MNPLAEMELEVPLRKLTDYLLSPTHPVGRHKARFFAALGFTAENPLDLVEALKLQARVTPEVQEEPTPFGLKWAARGKLLGPRGSARVVSVWVGEGCGGAEPCTRARLVTAYPAEGGRG